MKADKSFYDTLRGEVNQGVLCHSKSFLYWGLPQHRSEPTAVDSSQSNGKENKLSIDEKNQKLNEKIKGLESQIELLKEANRELTEKNKALEAKMKTMYEFPDDDFNYEYTDEHIDEMIRAEEEHYQYEADSYRRGYVSLKAIIEWGNKGTSSIGEARLIKDMIHNIMPNLSEEERLKVNEIGHAFREANLATPQVYFTNNFQSGSNNLVANRDINNPVTK